MRWHLTTHTAKLEGAKAPLLCTLRPSNPFNAGTVYNTISHIRCGKLKLDGRIHRQQLDIGQVSRGADPQSPTHIVPYAGALSPSDMNSNSAEDISLEMGPDQTRFMACPTRGLKLTHALNSDYRIYSTHDRTSMGGR